MSDIHNKFLADSQKKADSLEHKNKIEFNISKYNQTFKKGIQQYSNLKLAKERAKVIKWKAIEELDQMLLQFEANFTNNGGKVVWAKDDKEAIKEIKKVIKEKNAKSVVKSKSMTTEEIELNYHLENEGVTVYETDLGEFIVQLSDEKPYHIVTPAMHKSKEDVSTLFNEKFGSPVDSSAEELTLVARDILREKYLTSDIGITGSNFIIANEGAIAITENEGNARLTTAFPKTHIVIVGIEKVVSSIKDIAHFWPLLATFGTGQKVTAYNSLFFGPKQEDEIDGPEDMIVILLDNGRSELLNKSEMRESLYCIRCGACLNACPVYKSIGGHSYGTTYSGPIGSVISPHYKGMDKFKHLSFASSLCGNCSEVCPVNINIHELLMKNRKDAAEKGLSPMAEKWSIYAWKKGMLSRKLMNLIPSKLKSLGFNILFKNSWIKKRGELNFPKKSFNDQWKDQFK